MIFIYLGAINCSSYWFKVSRQLKSCLLCNRLPRLSASKTHVHVHSWINGLLQAYIKLLIDTHNLKSAFFPRLHEPDDTICIMHMHSKRWLFSIPPPLVMNTSWVEAFACARVCQIMSRTSRGWHYLPRKGSNTSDDPMMQASYCSKHSTFK